METFREGQKNIWTRQILKRSVLRWLLRKDLQLREQRDVQVTECAGQNLGIASVVIHATDHVYFPLVMIFVGA